MSEFMPLDQRQRELALDPQRSVIVQAPAGSGKTGLLTQRFLRLLAAVEQPEEIVAITFTRKAAAEMRERILAAMASASSPASGANANERRTLALARAALDADSAHGWQLLDNPARLRITTIDAFNAMLTRQLPVSSGLGQQPAIAENADDLCRDAVRRLLSGVDARDETGEALRALLAHLDNRVDDLVELLTGMLLRRELWLRHLEIGGLDRAALEAALAHEVESVLAALAADFPAHLHDAVAPLAARCRANLVRAGRSAEETEWLDQLAGAGRPSAQAAQLPQWRRLARFLLTTTGELRKPGGLNATVGFPAPGERGIDAAEKLARERHKQDMCEVLDALAGRDAVLALLARLELLPHAEYTDAQWRLLNALNTLMPYAVLALQETFRDRAEVDFAELSIRARQALGPREAPTELALKLDHRISHLLVDEFQDTSQGQIDLLLRLTRDWTPGDGRTLFVVGDPMQSIYQFREAEVGHFLAVRERGLGELDLESLRLSANFRSQAGIVEWVNAAFRDIFPRADDIASGAIAFEPSEPARPALPGRAVEVHAFAQHDAAGEAARVLELATAAVNDAANETTAILVRGRAHLAAILPLLREAGIPFRAVELESLESVPVVRDLLALTRALVNPADVTALLSVLRAPWCGLRLAELQLLVHESEPLFLRLRDPALAAVLPADAADRLRRVAGMIDAAEAARGRCSLRERVEAAWFLLGGPAALREPEELDDARLFFELLAEVEHAGDLEDVNAFDERLKQLFAAPDPEAGEALQIMTLHKAKGLQFDTVIIPALDQVTGRRDRLLFQWIERPQRDGGEQVLLGPLKPRDDDAAGAIYRFIERLKEEKEALERARLLYVGITRAKRRVHLCGKARYTFRNGSGALAPPRSGSLLELLWRIDEVRSAYEALPVPARKPEPPPLAIDTSSLRRLPHGWHAPALPAHPALQVSRPGTGRDNERVVYDWAGDRLRLVGTLVHRVLERMARDGIDSWPGSRIQQFDAERRLLDLGLPQAECADAAADVRAILERVRASARARWILDAHAEARNEWALGGMDRGERVNVTLDRSFVDAEGRRWIVDYKTSAHEGGDLADFLARQQARYRAQLERYARLAHALDGRPVRVGLYFPVLDEWREWEPELD